MGGIRIAGKILSNLKYADDIIFIGGEGSTAELQHLASRVDTIGRNYTLMIDIAKTKLMALRIKNCTIRIPNIIPLEYGNGDVLSAEPQSPDTSVCLTS